ncbi:Na(+)/H(+) antiporter subunit B [Wolbachia endosymbiont of Pentidionis agamae]|uniref:Na(+)/H(+) antiporter subunit B n=1 Tax=Wolbachia endosymbiont of Pentidionis agamae TaxID=3110435 RepID=UPI002FD17161
MIKDPILNIISFFMIPFIILLGLYIQFHGDYSPGGGFQAGIIIASGLILHAMLFGISTTLKAIPYSVIKFVVAFGIILYTGTGVLTMLLGSNFLSYNALLSNKVAGQKLGIFLIELGVGLTVCASMLMIYINFAQKNRSK